MAAVLLLSSACSGSGPKLTKEPVLDRAMKAMGKMAGTATGTIELAGGKSTFSVQWKGDLATGLGSVVGSIPAAGRLVPLDARWRSGSMYLKRTAQPQDYGSQPIGQVLGVKAGDSVWTYGSSTTSSANVLAAFSPPDVVRILAGGGVASAAIGPTLTDGSNQRVEVKSSRGLLFNWVGTKSAQLRVDKDDLVRYVEVRFGNERFTMAIEYSDVLPTVNVPPASELQTKSAAPVTPIGPYRTLRTGQTAGLQWSVQRAPGRDGALCWRWTSEPGVTVMKPTYRNDTRCFPSRDPDTDPVDLVDFVLTATGSGENSAVVVYMPKSITKGKLGFIGGGTQEVAIDDGLLVWVGPTATPPGFLALSSPEGEILCGIGAVGSVGDLGNESLYGDPFGTAWLCQN